MQIHELPAGSPASGVQFAGDTGTQTQKIDYDALADSILNKLTTKTFDIKSESQTIIAALNALGDASKRGVANNLVTTAAGLVLDARQGKALDDKIASLNSSLTPKSYTGYSFSAYSAADIGLSYVYIIGKICIFSLAFVYTSDYTPAATQIFINGMPKPAHDSYLQGMSFNGSSIEPFRCRVYANGNTGSISNYYSGMKTYANVPSIITGAYVIA